MRYGFLATSVRALVLLALFLTSLTAVADSPPPGGLPSAGRLQQLHEAGGTVGANTSRAERVEDPFGSRYKDAPNDLLRSKLNDYLKEHGSQWSEAEREVFSEAYWKGVRKESDDYDRDAGMTQITPPSLALPGASSTTVVSGKTPTPGPGTLQLTDAEGNSYFVDVDANGNYSTTVPQGNFQPDKATLWTKTGKLKRIVKSDGTWAPVSSATGTGTQGAMAPDKGTAGQQVAYVDECKRYAVIGSLGRESSPVAGLGKLWLRPVRFLGPRGAGEGRPGDPRLRLVSDPLPPDAIRAAQEQGILHADQEFEKSELEKIPEGSRTQAQTDRINELNKMIQQYKDFQKGIREAATKNPEFVDTRAVDITEQAAQARRLQRQAHQMRASGDPNLGPAADALEQIARQLMGGQSLPELRASAKEPLLWAGASNPTTGAMLPLGGRTQREQDIARLGMYAADVEDAGWWDYYEPIVGDQNQPILYSALKRQYAALDTIYDSLSPSEQQLFESGYDARRHYWDQAPRGTPFSFTEVSFASWPVPIQPLKGSVRSERPMADKLVFSVNAPALNVPTQGGSSFRAFAVTDEWTTWLMPYSLKLGKQEFHGRDPCGPTKVNRASDESITLKGTYVRDASHDGWRLTPRFSHQFEDNYTSTPLSGGSPPRDTGVNETRWWPDLKIGSTFVDGKFDLTFNPTLPLSNVDWYLDKWKDGFNDSLAKEAAGPSAKGLSWQYHGQALGDDLIIGASIWRVGDTAHKTFVHDSPYSQYWHCGEKDAGWSAAPAPSLDPRFWPRTDARVVPRTVIQLETP